MKQVTGTALALLAVVFLLPVLLLQGPSQAQQGQNSGTTDLNTQVSQPQLQQQTQDTASDMGQTLSLLMGDGSVQLMTAADYLWGVVAAEMPASFQLEALKAQAVAARTYWVRVSAAGKSAHPLADVCTDSACCQAYVEREQALANWGEKAEEYAQRITQAVEQTDGLGVLYDGQPIQAVYFSSAPGQTVDAQEVWGSAIPYLVSVDSPEGDEVPNYYATVSMSAQEFRSLVLAQYPQADLSGGAAGWVDKVQRGTSGMVTTLEVGGVELTGGQMRKLLGLRSACFTLMAAGDVITVQTTGYGHGVGMSQYGANTMAKQGSTFRDILTWYYTGAEVAALY